MENQHSENVRQVIENLKVFKTDDIPQGEYEFYGKFLQSLARIEYLANEERKKEETNRLFLSPQVNRRQSNDSHLNWSHSSRGLINEDETMSANKRKASFAVSSEIEGAGPQPLKLRKLDTKPIDYQTEIEIEKVNDTALKLPTLKKMISTYNKDTYEITEKEAFLLIKRISDASKEEVSHTKTDENLIKILRKNPKVFLNCFNYWLCQEANNMKDSSKRYFSLLDKIVEILEEEEIIKITLQDLSYENWENSILSLPLFNENLLQYLMKVNISFNQINPQLPKEKNTFLKCFEIILKNISKIDLIRRVLNLYFEKKSDDVIKILKKIIDNNMMKQEKIRSITKEKVESTIKIISISNGQKLEDSEINYSVLFLFWAISLDLFTWRELFSIFEELIPEAQNNFKDKLPQLIGKSKLKKVRVLEMMNEISSNEKNTIPNRFCDIFLEWEPQNINDCDEEIRDSILRFLARTGRGKDFLYISEISPDKISKVLDEQISAVIKWNDTSQEKLVQILLENHRSIAIKGFQMTLSVLDPLHKDFELQMAIACKKPFGLLIEEIVDIFNQYLESNSIPKNSMRFIILFDQHFDKPEITIKLLDLVVSMLNLEKAQIEDKFFVGVAMYFKSRKLAKDLKYLNKIKNKEYLTRIKDLIKG